MAFVATTVTNVCNTTVYDSRTELQTCLIFTQFDGSVLCLLPVWRGSTAGAAAWRRAVALLTEMKTNGNYRILSAELC